MSGSPKPRKPKNLVLSFLSATAVVIILQACLIKYNEDSPVFPISINEVCVANKGTDEGGVVTYEDYIELYNSSDSDVSLDGLYLSDDSGDLRKTPLAGITMESGGYFVIYAVGDDGEVPTGCEGASFKLSAGETVFLSHGAVDEDGRDSDLIEVVSSVTIPDDDVKGAAYTAATDGGTGFIWAKYSPGLSNAGAAQSIEEPVILTEGGFYEDGVNVEISAAEGLEIRYTLDGSDPDASSALYTEPLWLTDPSSDENVYSARTDIAAESSDYEVPDYTVDKIQVLKAAAFDGYGHMSNIVSESYCIDIADREGFEGAFILSLSTDPDNLFSEDGIYVRGSLYEEALDDGLINSELSWIELMSYTNYYVDGIESEREAYLQLFSADGELLLDQACGIRIRGGESRSFPQKSFTLYARDRYGDGSFDTDIFGTSVSASKLILNQGQRLNKVVFFSLLEDSGIAVQHYVPCQVFLDGEYWGMYYLMESYTAEYLNTYYGVDEDDVAVINDTVELVEGSDDDLDDFNDLIDFLTNEDLSDPDVYEELLGMIDMQSFIEWMCVNIYIANTDTAPLDGNVMTWKAGDENGSGYSDGRWRWLLYDLDDALAVSTEYEGDDAYAFDSFTGHAGWVDVGLLEIDPMPALMENEDFREQFVNTFMELADGDFSAGSVLPVLDAIEDEYASWAAVSYERWNTTPLFDTFESQIESLRTFFENRYDVMVPLLEEYFGSSGS